jgi:hypothetical protein
MKIALFGKKDAVSDRVLSDADKDELARSYETARQHYIRKCAREERVERRKREKKEGFRSDLKISLLLIPLTFIFVWLTQNADAIWAYGAENLSGLFEQIFGP